MAHRTSEQKLVDLTFSIAEMISRPEYNAHFQAMTVEERMAWVADQLRGCGFDTEPCGASWGVLK